MKNLVARTFFTTRQFLFDYCFLASYWSDEFNRASEEEQIFYLSIEIHKNVNRQLPHRKNVGHQPTLPRNGLNLSGKNYSRPFFRSWYIDFLFFPVYIQHTISLTKRGCYCLSSEA